MLYVRACSMAAIPVSFAIGKTVLKHIQETLISSNAPLWGQSNCSRTAMNGDSMLPCWRWERALLGMNP